MLVTTLGQVSFPRKIFKQFTWVSYWIFLVKKTLTTSSKKLSKRDSLVLWLARLKVPVFTNISINGVEIVVLLVIPFVEQMV